MNPTRRMLMVGLMLAACTSPAAQAHEAEHSKAVVVLRDGDHYSLTLHFDALRALHALRAAQEPGLSEAEFGVMVSAMPTQAFANVWASATAQWARELVLDRSGSRATAQRWRWPAADSVQALARQRLMHALTSGGSSGSGGGSGGSSGGVKSALNHDEHHVPLVVAQAEFRLAATGGRSTVNLRMPAALRPLSLTTYRPRQQWVGAGEAPVALSF